MRSKADGVVILIVKVIANIHTKLSNLHADGLAAVAGQHVQISVRDVRTEDPLFPFPAPVLQKRNTIVWLEKIVLYD